MGREKKEGSELAVTRTLQARLSQLIKSWETHSLVDIFIDRTETAG